MTFETRWFDVPTSRLVVGAQRNRFSQHPFFLHTGCFHGCSPGRGRNRAVVDQVQVVSHFARRRSMSARLVARCLRTSPRTRAVTPLSGSAGDFASWQSSTSPRRSEEKHIPVHERKEGRSAPPRDKVDGPPPHRPRKASAAADPDSGETCASRIFLTEHASRSSSRRPGKLTYPGSNIRARCILKQRSQPREERTDG